MAKKRKEQARVLAQKQLALAFMTACWKPHWQRR